LNVSVDWGDVYPLEEKGGQKGKRGGQGGRKIGLLHRGEKLSTWSEAIRRKKKEQGLFCAGWGLFGERLRR